MDQLKIKYVCDILMLLALIAVVGTGLLLGDDNEGARLGHGFSDLHAFASYSFIALLLIHFAFNGKWMICMTQNLFKKKPEKAEKKH